MSAFINSFLLVFAGLLPIINPPGSALLFLAMTRHGSQAERAELAKLIAFYAFLIVNVSFYVGAFVLDLFGISVPVLRVAGGLVLALAGWQLLNAPRESSGTTLGVLRETKDLKALAFYPLTMPLTTGPGTMALTIAIGTGRRKEFGVLFGALLATVALCTMIYLCYRFADRIQGALGETGSDALARIFAFILVCIGIQTLWSGFAELWSSLPR
jgi:multiple antibiotic resistance protein